jgi:hypothetical protein
MMLFTLTDEKEFVKKNHVIAFERNFSFYFLVNKTLIHDENSQFDINYCYLIIINNYY